MLNGVSQIFDNMPEMLKKLKKKSYERNFAAFEESFGQYLLEMTTYMTKASDKEKMAQELAAAFADDLEAKFKEGSKNKIKNTKLTDINFFMIYYVFPAILKSEHENAELLTESVCAEWASRYTNAPQGYADYDTLYGSFKEKIFGIF